MRDIGLQEKGVLFMAQIWAKGSFLSTIDISISRFRVLKMFEYRSAKPWKSVKNLTIRVLYSRLRTPIRRFSFD